MPINVKNLKVRTNIPKGYEIVLPERALKVFLQYFYDDVKKILEKGGLIYKLPDSGIYAKPRWVQVLNIDEYIRSKFGIEDLYE